MGVMVKNKVARFFYGPRCITELTDLDGCFPQQAVSIGMPQHDDLIEAGSDELVLGRMTGQCPQLLAVSLKCGRAIFSDYQLVSK